VSGWLYLLFFVFLLIQNYISSDILHDHRA
jgi:hypothetical protein